MNGLHAALVLYFWSFAMNAEHYIFNQRKIILEVNNFIGLCAFWSVSYLPTLNSLFPVLWLDWTQMGEERVQDMSSPAWVQLNPLERARNGEFRDCTSVNWVRMRLKKILCIVQQISGNCLMLIQRIVIKYSFLLKSKQSCILVHIVG